MTSPIHDSPVVLPEENAPSQRNDKERRLTISGVIAWIVALIFFAPIFWIFLAALKTDNTILAYPPKFIFTPTLENFAALITKPNVGLYFFNSVFLSVGSVAIAIVVSYLAAYSFSRFKPAGTDFLMFLLLSTRFVPAAAFVIPFFQLFGILNFKDTYVGLLIFYVMFSVPFSVWILKGFIDGVSQRFDETGLVNGASRAHVRRSGELAAKRAGRAGGGVPSRNAPRRARAARAQPLFRLHPLLSRRDTHGKWEVGRGKWPR